VSSDTGGVSIRFRSPAYAASVAPTVSTASVAGGGSRNRDVQARLDQLRSLLSDTREQLHESSIALSPAMGIPDVDDSDRTAPIGGGAMSFGGLDASSIHGIGGTVRSPSHLSLLSRDCD